MDPARARAVFRTWLRALAEDPSAAVAASLTYEELAPEGRDAWLDALDEDAREIAPLAVYAPLLAVEEDPARRARIARRLEGATLPQPTSLRAWQGDRGRERAAVVMAPVYLDFVEIVAARFDGDGFIDLVHVPLARPDDPLPDLQTELVPAAPADIVEELALVVLAHERAGKPRPEGAHALVRYLTPCIS